MTPEIDTGPPEPAGAGGGGGGGWVRPVALVASCLVIGFVGGWVLRGDNGTVTVLAPAAPADTGATGSVTTGGGPTTPATTATGGATTTAPAEPAPPPARADIGLTVLNGTGETGLAARIAGEAEGLGYNGVTAGNAPTTTDPSIVYFRTGQRAAALRVAKDLQIDSVRALPASGSLAGAVPDGVNVAIVLGTG